ncbi:hypothetical protein B0O99DRAFT_602930 [Bisporella sp. PMI_857]|nr:hypothetical protein B0O99DRAFT_602930 [Bisporella sp. PMI_857]
MHGSYATSLNKQMYYDALEVFYTKASFEFAEIPTEILCFLSRLPLEGLKFVRQLLFRVQPKQFFRWNQDNYLQQWRSLAVFIKINFNIPNLSIIIDSEEMYDHCIWAEQEEDNRFYYDISSQITDTMCILRGIHDIHFRLAWFTPMGPIFERRVIGDSYIDRHPQVKPSNPLYEMEWRIPSWHNTNLPAS